MKEKIAIELTPDVISAIDRLCDLAEYGGGHPEDKQAAELVRKKLNIKKRSDSFNALPSDLRDQFGYPEDWEKSKYASKLIDSISDRLEANGLIKEAYELDKIADQIEKLADAASFSKILNNLKAKATIQVEDAIKLVKAIENDKPRLLKYAMAEFGNLQEIQDKLVNTQKFYDTVQNESKRVLKDKYGISGNYHLNKE